MAIKYETHHKMEGACVTSFIHELEVPENAFLRCPHSLVYTSQLAKKKPIGTFL